MGEFLLIGYSVIKDKIGVLGSGTLDEIQSLKKSLDGMVMYKLKVVPKPSDVTLQELLSNDSLLNERFGDVKNE